MVDYEAVDLDIPIVLLNFVSGETGHSNGIMQLVMSEASATHLQYVQVLLIMVGPLYIDFSKQKTEPK